MLQLAKSAFFLCDELLGGRRVAGSSRPLIQIYTESWRRLSSTSSLSGDGQVQLQGFRGNRTRVRNNPERLFTARLNAQKMGGV